MGRKLVLVSGKKPQKRKASVRSWSKTKASKFLSVLAETCNVSEACRTSGIASGTAYKRKKTDAAFRAGWREAMAAAYSRLEIELLGRAFTGVEKVVTRRDGSEERMTEYSNQLGLTLLKMHRDSATDADPDSEPGNMDEVRERVFNKRERLRKREEARAGKE
jgi:hypothetical protein